MNTLVRSAILVAKPDGGERFTETSMKTGSKTTIAAATIAVLLGGTVGFAAEPRDATVAIRVQYSDLDLTREDGLATLRARLRAAAQRVCGDYDLRDVERRAEWKACYEKAFDEAAAQIEIPQRAANR